MNRKKIITIVMAACLVCGSGSSVLGYEVNNSKNLKHIKVVSTIKNKKNKISEEKVEEITNKSFREYFGIDTKELKCNWNISFSEADEYTASNYYVSWSSEDGLSLSTMVNAEDGKIMTITAYNYKNIKNSDIKIKDTEAKKAADEFINKINNSVLDKVGKAEINNYSENGSDYIITYYREENGVKFVKEYVRVTVNSSTGKVESYSLVWNDDLTFPSEKGIIDAKKAEELLKNDMNLELVYETFYKKSNGKMTEDVKLVYIPSFKTGEYVEAKTGKLKNFSPNVVIKTKDISKKEKEEFLSKYKAAEIKKSNGDEKSAKETAGKFLKELYGDKYSISIFKQFLNYADNRKNVWQGEFADKNYSTEVNVGSITVDANTGELLEIIMFYNQDYSKTKSIKNISYDEGYKMALDTVAKYYADKVKNLSTEQVIPEGYNDDTVYFRFNRIENAIPVSGDFINVSVDLKSGEVTSINYIWDTNVKLPENKNVISKDDIKAKIFKKHRPELIYDTVNVNEKGEPKFEVNVIYNFNIGRRTVIDANSGEFLLMN